MPGAAARAWRVKVCWEQPLHVSSLIKDVHAYFTLFSATETPWCATVWRRRGGSPSVALSAIRWWRETAPSSTRWACCMLGHSCTLACDQALVCCRVVPVCLHLTFLCVASSAQRPHSKPVSTTCLSASLYDIAAGGSHHGRSRRQLARQGGSLGRGQVRRHFNRPCRLAARPPFSHPPRTVPVVGTRVCTQAIMLLPLQLPPAFIPACGPYSS